MWNIKFTNALLTVVFTQSFYDYSLFTLEKKKGMVIILVYIDDFLLTGSNIDMINWAKSLLNQQFKLKHLGELQYFLGI